MTIHRKTGRVLHTGLLGAAFALVTGSASAQETYTCATGLGRIAAVLRVYQDPVTSERTCTAAPAVPHASAAAGIASCEEMALRVRCLYISGT